MEPPGPTTARRPRGARATPAAAPSGVLDTAHQIGSAIGVAALDAVLAATTISASPAAPDLVSVVAVVVVAYVAAVVGARRAR